MAYSFQTIVHPTDFSDASADAFGHALRVSLAMRSKLYLVHVGDLRYVHERDRFPSVRQALEQWRLLREDDPPTAVSEKLGIEVETVRLEPQDPVRGLFRFLETHPSDLIPRHHRPGRPRSLGPRLYSGDALPQDAAADTFRASDRARLR
jgi:nucleotide-binding universal stress UspA family protein